MREGSEGKRGGGRDGAGVRRKGGRGEGERERGREDLDGLAESILELGGAGIDFEHLQGRYQEASSHNSSVGCQILTPILGRE